MLYFSYGSNMSIKRLLSRAPSARVISIATLQKHDLRFHKKGMDGSGKCDVFKTDNPEHSVIGVVFDITKSDKIELDRKEGLGNGYEEKVVGLTTGSGENICAITYYATDIVPDLKPFHWYKHHVKTGAIEVGLPEIYIEKISIIESIADPDQERHNLEMAIYTPPDKLEKSGIRCCSHREMFTTSSSQK